MSIRLMKFGGSSVGTPARVENVINIIREGRETVPVAAVISAFSGVTDHLISMCRVACDGDESYKNLYQELVTKHYQFAIALLDREQSAVLQRINQRLEDLRDVLHGVFLLKELSPKILDYVMSFGEWFSCMIIATALEERGVKAAFVDARDLVRTDNRFGNARVDFAVTNRQISDYFAGSKKQVHIITGFCGSTAKGETTTLGRSGSDYTAAIFGAALDAPEIEIWTDVDGVMTADPRKVTDAFSQPLLTYEEALEMSHFGAKVIHPPTMLPAMRKNIPIRILNTFNPEFPGTLIHRQPDEQHLPANGSSAIKGVTSIPKVALLRVEGPGMIGVAGTSMRIFSALATAGVNIILITQASSEHSICLAVAPQDATIACDALRETFELEIQTNRINPPILEEEMSIVAIVGEKMRHTPGIAGRFFQALGQSGVNVVAIAQGSSERNISVVIFAPDEPRALNAVHNAFFRNGMPVLNVFLAGVGLVGSELLSQIDRQHAALSAQKIADLRLAGIANSRRCVINPAGIDPGSWQAELEKGSDSAGTNAFVNQLISLHLPNKVFVDCTTSEALANSYAELLAKGISIVAANKKANSGDYRRYAAQLDALRSSGAAFYYETNVGAGLPVISTLRDLLRSGDTVHRINAVLSGTLSYIFNTFDGSVPFSKVVRNAKDLGYTEPDPREDLNGLDVARKLLILARECGLKLGLSDISVENLLPENCRNADSVAAFFRQLELADGEFAGRLKRAEKNGQRLRYIASLSNDEASVSLQAVGTAHPFYDLSGSDNIIAFTTARYSERPLVIRGPGAGAAVTAAGVFADILRTARSG